MAGAQAVWSQRGLRGKAEEESSVIRRIEGVAVPLSQAQTLAEIRGRRGVTLLPAHEVMGPYDIIVEIQADNLVDPPPILSNQIRAIPGIQSTHLSRLIPRTVELMPQGRLPLINEILHHFNVPCPVPDRA